MRSLFAAVCIFFACVTPAHAQADLVDVVEFYNASLDHYFITWVPDEISKLDAGTVIKGWTRTGKTLKTYSAAQANTSPVCRFYIPPALGNSHYFGRGTTECNDTGTKNPSFVLEDPGFMHMYLPNLGTCPADTTPVYRVFSNRPDANHRYMTDGKVRAAMVAKGWLAEGDGPDFVVLCSPPQPPTKVTIYTETTNPLLLSFVPEGGVETTFFGEKDSVGTAKALKGIYFQDSPTSQTLASLDASGRPLALNMADGATIRFTWQPSGSANIEVVTADGKIQANTSLHSLLPKSFSEVLSHPGFTWIKADPVKASLQVSVHESGIPVSDATIMAVIEGRSTKKTYKLPLASVGPGPGVYATQFVNSPSAISSGAVESSCTSIVTLASNSCAVLSPVSKVMVAYGCLAVAAEVALVGTPVAGAAVLPVCETTFGGVVSTCTAVEIGAGTQSGLCKLIDATVALYDGDGVRITAKADKGQTSGSSTNDFAGSVTSADMSVSLICPSPLVPFNGVCYTKLPLTKTWVGDYKYSVKFGGCNVSYSGTGLMLLTQTGATFEGNLFAEVYSIDTKTCAVDPTTVSIIATIAGTIDGKNNIAMTSTSGAGSTYTGPGTLRNGILKVDISNTTDFGGLGTFSFTLN